MGAVIYRAIRFYVYAWSIVDLDYVQSLIDKRYAISIMGATATGKSKLSIDLARLLPIEIISVDSSLIYKGMDIGTAKPSKLEREVVPHHLIDILEPTQSYSVAKFIESAKSIVEDVFSRNRIPVLVGGTMMYFNGLQKGISILPSSDKAVREYWLNKWNENPTYLHNYLQEIDPLSAKRIHSNDKQRLIRAIEIYEISKKTMSYFIQQETKPLTEFKLIKFALLPEDRKKLHERIETRFKQMLSDDFVGEVKRLKEKYPSLNEDTTSMRSVGYRQCFSYLNGEIDLLTLQEKSIIATRRLAKRQITWLRKEENLTLLNTVEQNLGQNLEQSLEQNLEKNLEHSLEKNTDKIISTIQSVAFNL